MVMMSVTGLFVCLFVCLFVYHRHSNRPPCLAERRLFKETYHNHGYIPDSNPEVVGMHDHTLTTVSDKSDG